MDLTLRRVKPAPAFRANSTEVTLPCTMLRLSFSVPMGAITEQQADFLRGHIKDRQTLRFEHERFPQVEACIESLVTKFDPGRYEVRLVTSNLPDWHDLVIPVFK